MGKSSKKSGTKVDASAAVALPNKSAKKGKREAEVVIEKLTVKKQKLGAGLEQAAKKKTSEINTQKKKSKKQESSSSSEDSSDSDEEPKEPTFKADVPSKNGAVASSSDSSESDSDEKANPPKKKLSVREKNGKLATSGKKVESSESSESESDPEEEVEKFVKGIPSLKKKEESSDETGSDSSSDEKPTKSQIRAPNVAVVTKKEEESSDETDSDSSSDEKPTKSKIRAPSMAAVTKKEEESSDDTDSDSSSDDKSIKTSLKKYDSSSAESSEESDEEPEPKMLTLKKEILKKDESSSDESSEESDEEPESKKLKLSRSPSSVGKSTSKISKNVSSSDEDSSDESSEDDEPSKEKLLMKPRAQVSKESSSDEDKSDDESESESESEEEQPSKTLKKPIQESNKSSSEEESTDTDSGSEEKPPLKTPMRKGTDVEMVDAVSDGKKAAKTPAANVTPLSGSKTVFVGNLSFEIAQDDMRKFFEGAGEIFDIRFGMDAENNFRGFGHVEFATAEAAQKALELNGKLLLGRAVRLSLASERGSFNLHSRKEGSSYQKGEKDQVKTVFVRGFDSSIGADEARAALEEHFGSCGEISRLYVPKDHESGVAKGIAYIDFNDAGSFKKAMELSNSELGGYALMVVEARPRGDFRGDSGGRGNRMPGGRDGGRFSGRGRGRDGGRGRGGRGNVNRPGAGTAPQGKKTIFGD